MINNNDIKKILSMSDEELQSKITDVIKVTGKNSDSVKNVDIGKIKNVVSKMSEKDINALLLNVPPEKLDEIRNIVKSEK